MFEKVGRMTTNVCNIVTELIDVLCCKHLKYFKGQGFHYAYRIYASITFRSQLYILVQYEHVVSLDFYFVMISETCNLFFETELLIIVGDPHESRYLKLWV